MDITELKQKNEKTINRIDGLMNKFLVDSKARSTNRVGDGSQKDDVSNLSASRDFSASGLTNLNGKTQSFMIRELSKTKNLIK